MVLVISREYHFPEDAIHDVLTKLPVKSLARFSCVSKNWSSLIKQFQFCLKHFENYNRNNTRLVVSFWILGVDGRYTLCLFPDETLEDLSYEEVANHMPIQGHVISSQYGIFCIFGYNKHITLWNLATKEYRTLPRCRAVLPNYMKIWDYDVKFGLDPISDDLKLVLIGSLDYERGSDPCEYSYVSIYSLGTNDWKRIKGNELIPYRIEHQYDGTYINGLCYWLAYSKDGHQFVLSFDMGFEVFQEMERPAVISEATMIYLGLCDSFLSCLVYKEVDGFFDIWVRKGMIWSKHLNAGPVLSVRSLLEFWENNTFLIQSRNEELLLYDPSSQKLTFLGLKAYGFSVFSYKESLMDIKDYNCISDIPWHVLGVDST